MDPKTDGRHIILFDGVCNLCNGSVNFIIARDPHKRFLFSPIQSEFSGSLLKKHDLEGIGHDSFVLISKGRCYLRSDAALEISTQLPGFWPLLAHLKIVPRPVRNFVYNLIAQNRYRLFGKTATCRIPDPQLLSRFILDE